MRSSSIILLQLHGVLGVVLSCMLHVGVILLLIRCIPSWVHGGCLGRGGTSCKLGGTSLGSKVTPLVASGALNRENNLRNVLILKKVSIKPKIQIFMFLSEASLVGVIFGQTLVLFFLLLYIIQYHTLAGIK